MVKIEANKTKLLETLKKFKPALPNVRRQPIYITCELTVIDSNITFTIPGVQISMSCKTLGTCKCTFTFSHFYQIINDFKGKIVDITIKNENMQIGGVSIDVKTTFFKDDNILRTINLPIDYQDIDLLRLERDGYTWQEITFNNLAGKVVTAESRLKRNIAGAYKCLKGYRVSREEIIKMAEAKIFPNKN